MSREWHRGRFIRHCGYWPPQGHEKRFSPDNSRRGRFVENQTPPCGTKAAHTDLSPQRRRLRNGRHGITDCSLHADLFDKRSRSRRSISNMRATTTGGAVLLKAAERQYGLIDGFAECLVDDRQPGKVRHTLADLLGQRIFGIACGHPDGNDASLTTPFIELLPTGGDHGRRRLPRNRRSRGLKTTWGAKSSMPRGRSWR